MDVARGVRTRPWASEICSPGLVPPPSAAHTQHWGGVEFTRYTCEVDGQQAQTPPSDHASTSALGTYPGQGALYGEVRGRPTRGRSRPAEKATTRTADLTPWAGEGGGNEGCEQIVPSRRTRPAPENVNPKRKVGENRNYVLYTECMIQCKAAERNYYRSSLLQVHRYRVFT